MDSTFLVGVIGAIGTVVAAIAGWFSKQGLDAYLKIRADKRIDAEIDDKREDQLEEREENTLRFIIGRQDGEITSLRREIREASAKYMAELSQLHEQHNECEKRHAALQAELNVRMEYVRSQLDTIQSNQKETTLAVAAYHEEAQKGDSKIILEVHADKILMPDGTELDPSNPDDAKLINRVRRRRMREAKRAAESEPADHRDNKQ